MALTPSAMPELGMQAPAFSLYDTVSGKKLSLSDLRSEKATVVMFICNHCPFVKHIRPELIRTAREFIPKGISFIAISANDVQTHPDDSPEKMKELARELDFPFPYLYDETQTVAKAYQAECTPDFFVYDKDLLLIYRGQFDDSRPSNQSPVTGKDLREVLNAVLANRPVPSDQKPSIGCNIKWITKYE